jgi:hypothetical protein
MDEYRDGVRSRPRMIFPTRVSGRSGGGASATDEWSTDAVRLSGQ